MINSTEIVDLRGIFQILKSRPLEIPRMTGVIREHLGIPEIESIQAERVARAEFNKLELNLKPGNEITHIQIAIATP